MITRKKVSEAFVNMLKSYDSTFYGKHNLVQTINSNPLMFDNSRANNRNLINVYVWIDETLPDVIASQNHFEIYLLNIAIHANYSNRNDSVEKIDETFEYIRQYVLAKEYNGLVLSEFYNDTNSSIISMTPIESNFPPPDEDENNEIVVTIDSAIEIYANIW